MLTPVVLVVSLLLDQWLGEPKRYHPLVGFGALATRLESFVRNKQRPWRHTKLAGLFAWAIMVALPVGLLFFIIKIIPNTAVIFFLNVLVLLFCVGGKSLAEHAFRVMKPLERGDLSEARRAVAMIVSRDTQAMDQTATTKATLESVLENGSDGVVAPLFWFVVAGAPGALLYRLANTLDAMWGYRNERYQEFGWASAKMDDLLNWVPARICAIGYALAGNFAEGWRCWQQQGYLTDSPNAGVVMATGAGALGVELGGSATYSGQLQQRPVLGCGRPAEIVDIDRALSLLKRCVILWLALVFVLTVVSQWTV